jgi:hypothetical protein
LYWRSRLCEGCGREQNRKKNLKCLEASLSHSESSSALLGLGFFQNFGFQITYLFAHLDPLLAYAIISRLITVNE